MKGDYAVRCWDCDRLYAPLSKVGAIERAVDHTEKTEHSKCHAVPLEELYPLIGTFHRGVED